MKVYEYKLYTAGSILYFSRYFSEYFEIYKGSSGCLGWAANKHLNGD
jgi:hypothetical protein